MGGFQRFPVPTPVAPVRVPVSAPKMFKAAAVPIPHAVVGPKAPQVIHIHVHIPTLGGKIQRGSY